MDQAELKDQIAFNKMLKEEALREEFENLRPKWREHLSEIVFLGCTVFAIYYLFPHTIEQPAIMILFFLLVGSETNKFRERKLINKRIDILYKLLKEEIRQKS